MEAKQGADVRGNRYEVFQSRNPLRAKRWRFRLVAANNENVGPSSQWYWDEHDAKRGAIDHQHTAASAEIVVVPS